MREDNKKFKTLSRRAFVLGALKGFLLSTLLMRYYYLQILDGKKYWLLSEKNRIHLDFIPPIRGNIFAADGQLIAGNRPAHRLVMQVRTLKQLHKVAQELNDIMNNPNFVDNHTLEKVKAGFLPNHYITLRQDLAWEEITKLSNFHYRVPEVSIVAAPLRYYPYHDVIGHISGYIASPTAKEQAQYHITDGFDVKIGKNGVEKQQQELLQGQSGVNKVEVNVFGAKIRNIETQPSTKGDDIHLAINIGLQQFVHELLMQQYGSAVVLDIDTGQVLAMHSTPCYDPNLFVAGINAERWQDLVNNPNSPLINKTISFAYPPGSTFKPIPALALLSSGIDPNAKIFCNGEYAVGDRVFHCWKRTGHGAVDFVRSLSASCNVYYYHMAARIGINAMHNMANLLGLGQCSGIELPFETCGLMPSKAWKYKRYNKPWTLGDTVNSIIGQGYVLATPLQLAVMIARVASGNAVLPTIFRHSSAKTFAPLGINNAWLQLVKKGMYNSINSPDGTGYRHKLPFADFELSGKTGTAQVASLSANNNIEDHGLFVGFAPYHKPKYAISVMVEHGKWGSQSAAPLAAKIAQFIHNNMYI